MAFGDGEEVVVDVYDELDIAAPFEAPMGLKRRLADLVARYDHKHIKKF